jgi:hypothetical protein
VVTNKVAGSLDFHSEKEFKLNSFKVWRCIIRFQFYKDHLGIYAGNREGFANQGTLGL